MVDAVDVKDAAGSTVSVATMDALLSRFGGVGASAETDPAAASATALSLLRGVLSRLSTLQGLVDGLETLIGTTNSTLTAVDGRVDGLEALITSLNGYADGLETLITSTNTKLDTLAGHEDGVETLLATLAGHVDTLETLIGATNTALATLDGRVDGLETLITATNTAIATIGTRSYTDASGQHVSFTGTSAQSNAITATEVTICASKDCYVAFGSNPTASAGAGSMFLAAGVPFTRRITSGHKVAAIQVSEAGALSILPVA